MTEEFHSLIHASACRFCHGEGTLHSCAPHLIRFAATPEYVETHRLCPQCEGTGTLDWKAEP